jgi:two-component system phosphate regulon sensor histidine kinase PhoR
MKTLRGMLVLRIGLSLLAAFALAALLMTLLVRGRLIREQERSLMDEARTVARLMEPLLREGEPQNLDSRVKQIMAGSQERLTVVDEQGWVLADSEADPADMDNHADRPELKEALAGREATSMRRSPTLYSDYIYAATPIFENGEVVGAVRVSVQESGSTGAAVSTGLLLAAILAVLLTALYLEVLQAQRELRRELKEIGHAARALVEEENPPPMPRLPLADLRDLVEGLEAAAHKSRQQYRSLRLEKERLEAVLDGVSSGIIGLGADGRIELMNHAAEKILGTERSRCEGRLPVEAYPSTAIERMAGEAMKGSEAETEAQISHPRRRVLRIKANPIWDSSGEVGGAILVMDDLTEARGTERMRRDFVANVSHELRTPVANLRAVIEALGSGAMGEEEKARRFLKDLDSESARLARLIEDLLTLSRLESAEFAPLRQRVGLAALLKEVAGDKRLLSERFDVEVALRDNGEEVLVEGDLGLIRTACANLLDNAIKYNRPGGEVIITLKKAGGEAEISFRDSGIGIPPEDRERVFERFYRVDRARSRETGGTGLGLSIVRHVAELHGGRVDLKSTEGQGSVFTLTLPIEEEEGGR